MLKMALLAPIPTGSVTIVTKLNNGLRQPAQNQPQLFCEGLHRLSSSLYLIRRHTCPA